MRRLIALLVVAALLVGFAAPAAHAGDTENIALGLASFAVFNQLVRPLLHQGPTYRKHGHYKRGYYPPAYEHAVYTTPRQYVVVQPPPPPPPPTPTVIHYPHGRYELRAYGAQYQWVWIPNPPPPPPPPPPSP